MNNKDNTKSGNSQDNPTHSNEVKSNHFPLEVFPPEIIEIFKVVNESMNFPIEYLGSSLIAVASVAIGNSIRVKVKETWLEHCSIYMVLIGRSGINKTHPLNFLSKPLEALDKQEEKKFNKLEAQYLTNLEMSSSEKKKNNIESPIEQPSQIHYILKDSTPESIRENLMINPRGILYYKDELVAWIKDFNRYSNGSEEEMWLSFWNGIYEKSTRVGRKAISIHNPFISVVGTTQKKKLKGLIDSSRSVNGFIDRLLFSFPENLQKSYLSKLEVSASMQTAYENIINKLISLKYHEELGSEIVNFNEDSYKDFEEFYNKNADIINDVSISEEIKSMYSKFDNHFIRLSLIIQMLYWATNNGNMAVIEKRSTEAAFKLCNYYINEGLKVRDYLNISTFDNNINEKTIAKYLNKEKKFSVRQIAEILQKSKSSISNYLNQN